MLEGDQTQGPAADQGDSQEMNETSPRRRRGPRRAATRAAGPPAALTNPFAVDSGPTAPAEQPKSAAADTSQAGDAETEPAQADPVAADGEATDHAIDAASSDPGAEAASDVVESEAEEAIEGEVTDEETAAEPQSAAVLGQEIVAAPPATVALFQAPDLSAAQPRKPAQDQAGSQGSHSEAGDDDADAAPDESDSNETEAEGGSGRRRRSRSRRRRGNKSNADVASGSDDSSTGSTSQEGAELDSDSQGGAQAQDQGATDPVEQDGQGSDSGEDSSSSGSRRRRRRRRSSSSAASSEAAPDDPPDTVVKVRTPRTDKSDVTSVRGSTRLEAKRQRRREGREAGRRRAPILTEAEFLARRESVERDMVVRQTGNRTQIAVLEDDILVEHYVASNTTTATMVGNIYLGRVQNVLPSMEAAFVDIGRGRNAVLYAGEVNWDGAGLEGQPRRIELALKSGDPVLVQVTKDPIGHKGARLTSQISLPGRYLVYVPDGSMTGISRKLPDAERSRLRSVLKAVVPEGAGVIVRTAAEGASEEELTRDVQRLAKRWESVQQKAKSAKPPKLLNAEPDLAIRVVRDIFNEDFRKLVVEGDKAWTTVSEYVDSVAPDLADRLEHWTGTSDVFSARRIDEQLAKALDRKVWLPSGGSLIIEHTEAMAVIDVNTGKFTGQGGNLEETVTKNNLEAAEEIVRQIRLRDIGGIVVIDFIDMVLESNRDLVLRRLVECLGRDRTKHQVAEVTSLGLVQMTRKRIGSGLLEAFTTTCEHCQGRGVKVTLTGAEGPRGAPKKAGHDPVELMRKAGGSDEESLEADSAPDSGDVTDSPTELAEGAGDETADVDQAQERGQDTVGDQPAVEEVAQAATAEQSVGDQVDQPEPAVQEVLPVETSLASQADDEPNSQAAPEDAEQDAASV